MGQKLPKQCGQTMRSAQPEGHRGEELLQHREPQVCGSVGVPNERMHIMELPKEGRQGRHPWIGQ